MAMVVICGQPCSGKSTAARYLASALASIDPKPYPNVRIIDESSLHLDRNCSYADMPTEKNLRGVLRSEVDRAVSKDSIIIIDSLNNIKGYRYELWCLARAAGIRYCVLFCDVEENDCREWNTERAIKKEESYNDNIFEDLIRRFEKPDNRNRWDSPLFELWPAKAMSYFDDSYEPIDDDELPMEENEDYLPNRTIMNRLDSVEEENMPIPIDVENSNEENNATPTTEPTTHKAPEEIDTSIYHSSIPEELYKDMTLNCPRNWDNPVWKYAAYATKKSAKETQGIQCLLYGFICTGGIHRIKLHISRYNRSGNKLGVKTCLTTPRYIMDEIIKVLDQKILSKKPLIVDVEMGDNTKNKGKGKMTMSIASSSSSVKKLLIVGR